MKGRSLDFRCSVGYWHSSCVSQCHRPSVSVYSCWGIAVVASRLKRRGLKTPMQLSN